MAKPDQMLADALHSYRHDPYGFVLWGFAWGSGELRNCDGPDDWQRETLISIGDQLRTGGELGCIIREAVASGHGIGKSALVAWLVLWSIATCVDAMGVVTANTETQLRTKTWSNVAKWHRLFIAKHLFTLTATALYAADPSHEKTWRVDAIPWSEHNTEAFAGLHNQGRRILLIFDEASSIADPVWEVSEGALTDQGTEIIWCAFGNPTRNTGRFKDCFGRHKHRWHTRQIDSRTSKLTNKQLIAEQIADYGLDSDFVKVRIRGIFPSMSALQFYSEPDVDAAFGRYIKPEAFNFAPKILTLDPAWEGDDDLVFGLRQGLMFNVLKTLPKNDNDIEVANLLARYEDEERADAVAVDGGYGTGIVSCGRTWGRNWQLVWFSGKSSTPGYLNKRAEMAQEAKLWLKQGGCIPPDQSLRDAILAPETIPRTDGVIQLESKLDIKKRLGYSSGAFDAWLLSFAFPVVKHVYTRLDGSLIPSNHQVDYDPYDT